MEPVEWQIIVGVVIAIALIAALAWFFTRKRRRSRNEAGAGLHRNPTMAEVESLRERNELLSSSVDRHERSYGELKQQLDRLRADYETRLSNIDALEKSQRELQEQIYELREEHKVLLQREDRQERIVHDLEARLMDSDGHARTVR